MNKILIKTLLLAAVLSVNFAGVSAAPTQIAAPPLTPDALVVDLYKMHDQDLKINKDRILNGKNRAVLNKYFDKTLAGLMWKDLTTHKNEVGVLDFDPFYNAQDFDIKKLVIGQPKTVGDKATIVVIFENANRRERLTYSLVQQNSAWKISNISYADGTRLLKYFKDDAKNNRAK